MREPADGATVMLEESILESGRVSALARRIAGTVLQMLGEMARECATATISLSEEKAEVIAVTPKRKECSCVSIWLYRTPVNDDQLVGISAGSGVYFNIPETCADPEQDVVDIVSSAVRAIASGNLV